MSDPGASDNPVDPGPFGPSYGSPYPIQPGYPGYPSFPGYPNYRPPAQPPYPASADPTGLALPIRIGARGWGRPVPRLGVALAGAGAAVAALGVLVWGADLVGEVGGIGSNGDTTARQLLGVLLASILVVGGYTLAAAGRSSPLASAGVAASGLGVPMLLGFATYSSGGSGPPLNIDVVALVSVLVWVVSYLFVPPVAGHTSLPRTGDHHGLVHLIHKAEPTLTSFPVPLLPGDNGELFGGPDLGTVAALSLMIGLGYYLVAFVLDHAGRSRPAVPFVVAGFVAVVAGLLATLPSVHAAGTGLLTIAVAAALAWYGARARRRFTAWAWAGGLAVGIVSIIEDLGDENATGPASCSWSAAGAGCGRQAYASLRGEPERRRGRYHPSRAGALAHHCGDPIGRRKSVRPARADDVRRDRHEWCANAPPVRGGAAQTSFRLQPAKQRVRLPGRNQRAAADHRARCRPPWRRLVSNVLNNRRIPTARPPAQAQAVNRRRARAPYQSATAMVPRPLPAACTDGRVASRPTTTAMKPATTNGTAGLDRPA